MAEYVSINAGTIRKNAVTGSNEPPIRIARSKSDKKPRYAHAIEITGKCKLIYSPRKPILRCGARLVLQAEDGAVKVRR
jgi:hypothetical protein